MALHFFVYEGFSYGKVFQHVLSGESHLMMWYLKLGF